VVKKHYQTELFWTNELISYSLQAISSFFGLTKQTIMMLIFFLLKESMLVIYW